MKKYVVVLGLACVSLLVYGGYTAKKLSLFKGDDLDSYKKFES
ncbi:MULTISPECIES: hypothetical protein [Leuconostoc]|jgi:hypothetical protein|uniref:Uncharacterized protein n=1 Tax=Leuconostoc citreum TaxID=33964 RepID=A0A5A5TXI0_LEUCI|nr:MULTISPECIES: hypothetical protein [Leuconostoc]MDM7641788.1 hypothetical protein [Leuconostoc citreum]MDU7281370.1 hypothetical protein [Leuconostoc citreum]MDY5162823.1 hypothetical protein [Leuconostoc citreum]MDY5166378.1 hypothetical protein [Leuconostoc citreum]UVW15998.1 hypothetical protein NX813_06145 [Leuconostoc citreum]